MMAVLDPIKLVIDNYPEDQVEYLDVINNLENEELGMRKIPFCRELYINRDDFMEEPPKKYFRLFPGNEVRLMQAYFVTCTGFERMKTATSQWYTVRMIHRRRAEADLPEEKSKERSTGYRHRMQ